MRLGQVKSGIVKLLCPLGGYQLARLITCHVPRVLMYHRFSKSPEVGKVTATTFRRQLADIAKNFRVIYLSDLINALRQGIRVPPHAIVLTFDDGYRDFYTVAYPILKEFRMPATVFVTTDFIDGLTWLWPDIISYALANTSRTPGSICEELGLPADPYISSHGAWRVVAEHCLSVSDEERHRLLDRILHVSGVKFLPKAIPDEYGPLSWDQIREMHANGVNIGGHTKSHPNLVRLPAALLKDEILGCKLRIEQEIGEPTECFCYPNGMPEDYNDAVKSVVEASGFIGAAVGFHDAMVTTDPYEIRRYSASENIHQFRKAINGVEYCGARLNDWLQHGSQHRTDNH